MIIWVWLKIKQEGLRRFWSMFPLTRVPFWYRFFEPQLFRKKHGANKMPCLLQGVDVRRQWEGGLAGNGYR